MIPATCHPYLPPEWAPQSGVLLTWPHAHTDWAPDLAAVEPVFTDIARTITRFEPVLVACYDETQRQRLKRHLTEAGVPPNRMRLHIAPSNDSWARDHGPVTVLCEGEPTLLDFQFNGWGGKYPAGLDNTLTRELFLAEAFGNAVLEHMDLVLEGGSIEADGSGTLLTTSDCLLSPTRNPDLSWEQLEEKLSALFGINHFLWLDHGHLLGDDTDSHIDTLARFCDVNTIAYVSCEDSSDDHYAELKKMEEQLQHMKSITDECYRLEPLPLPSAKVSNDGRRLPATYTNFLIINDAVLVPTYDDPADEAALACLRQCFPKREVIGIDCLPLIKQNGSLHCVTMQLPMGVLT